MNDTESIQAGTRVAYRAGFVSLCVTREDQSAAFNMTGTVLKIASHKITGEPIATVQWDEHGKPETTLLNSIKPIS